MQFSLIQMQRALLVWWAKMSFCNQQDADNLLTAVKGGCKGGYIFRDNLSPLINDTYLLQFLKIRKEDGSSTGDPRDWDGQGPVLLTRGKLMVCAQCPDRWPVTSQSNTIRTQFPNLISAVSHNKLPHSEKWEWMVMWGVWRWKRSCRQRENRE